MQWNSRCSKTNSSCSSFRNEGHIFNAIIVPAPINSNGPSPRDNLYMLDFDLAITIEKKSNTSNEAGISVIGIEPNIKVNANFKENITETNAFISRMKFQIPVIYPSSPKPHI